MVRPAAPLRRRFSGGIMISLSCFAHEAGKLVLTHLPAGLDPRKAAASVSKIYGGPVVIAEDFMEIEL